MAPVANPLAHWSFSVRTEQIEVSSPLPSMFREFIPGPTHVENLVYDDGRERREYAVTTAEDAQGLLSESDRVATIARIEATQEPVAWVVRPG